MKVSKEIVCASLKARLSPDLIRMLNTYDPHGLERLSELLSMQYGQSFRHYHDWNHICNLLRFENSSPEYQIAALFHDFIYNPLEHKGGNEARSSSACFSWLNSPGVSLVKANVDWSLINRAIMATTEPQKWLCDPTHAWRKSGTIELQLVMMDWQLFWDQSPENINDLYQYELGISKEFQYAGWSTYVENRLKFLNFAQSLSALRDSKAPAILKGFLNGRKPRIGIYPGSFNPFHAGHLDILRQGEAIFDMVYLAIGCNPEKPGAWESLNQRYQSLSANLPFHRIERFSGFLVRKVQELESQGLDVTVIMGLRTDTDFKKTEVDIRASQDLYPGLKVCELLCSKNHEHVSSTMIRQMNGLESGLGTSLYVPSGKGIYGGGEF